MNAITLPGRAAPQGGRTATWQQPLTALALALLWTIFLYRDTGLAMVSIWARSETFNHDFLVPPLVLWLVWRQRSQLVGLAPRPDWRILPWVAVTALVWLLGELAAVNAVTQLAFVALLVLSVPVVLGWAVARVMAFPLGFLFFSVPLGEFLLPVLMEWTANFTVLALRLSGIPVFREGLQFVIPSGNWSVVEACSGVRYLIASLTVGTLFAYLNYRSNRRRLLFVLVSLLVPIVANWLRAYLIVLLGHLSDNRLAAGVDHLIYGWVFFGVVMALMFAIGARWSEPDEAPGAALAAQPMSSVTSTSVVSATWLWLVAFGLALVLALPQMLLWSMARADAATPAALTFQAPSLPASSWLALGSQAPLFKPAYQTPSHEIVQSYRRDDRVVGLYVGAYQKQNYSHKLIGSENVLVVSLDPTWAFVSRASQPLTLGQQPVVMRSTELRGAALTDQGDNRHLLVWQIYWVNGTLTANDYLATAYGALDRLLGRGGDGAVILVYTRQDAGSVQALSDFMATHYAAIDTLLQGLQPAL